MIYAQKRGLRLLSRGYPKKAYTFFEKALFSEANGANYFNMGICLMALNKHQEAAVHLQKALQFYPKNDIILLTAGENFLMLRAWEEAITCYENLTEIHPGSPKFEAYLLRAKDVVIRERYVISNEKFAASQTYIMQKKYEEALQLMQEAFALNPQNAVIANNLGSLSLVMGKGETAALPYFETALNLEPSNPRFRENVTLMQKRLQKK